MGLSLYISPEKGDHYIRQNTAQGSVKSNLIDIMKYSYILVNLLTEFKFLPTTDVKRKILINSRVSDKIRKLANM